MELCVPYAEGCVETKESIDVAVIHHDVCRDIYPPDLLDLLDWEHAEAMLAWLEIPAAVSTIFGDHNIQRLQLLFYRFDDQCRAAIFICPNLTENA
jgi:hypothetical protein